MSEVKNIVPFKSAKNAAFLFYEIKFFSMGDIKNLIPFPTGVKNMTPFPKLCHPGTNS
jgi:hypothetical protein